MENENLCKVFDMIFDYACNAAYPVTKRANCCNYKISKDGEFVCSNLSEKISFNDIYISFDNRIENLSNYSFDETFFKRMQKNNTLVIIDSIENELIRVDYFIHACLFVTLFAIDKFDVEDWAINCINDYLVEYLEPFDNFDANDPDKLPEKLEDIDMYDYENLAILGTIIIDRKDPMANIIPILMESLFTANAINNMEYDDCYIVDRLEKKSRITLKNTSKIMPDQKDAIKYILKLAYQLLEKMVRPKALMISRNNLQNI